MLGCDITCVFSGMCVRVLGYVTLCSRVCLSVSRVCAGFISLVCSWACVLACVHLFMVLGVCQGVGVLTFVLCVLSGGRYALM